MILVCPSADCGTAGYCMKPQDFAELATNASHVDLGHIASIRQSHIRSYIVFQLLVNLFAELH